MHATHEFDILYGHLSETWQAHEAVRRSHTSISELAESSFRLSQARAAMRDWHCRCSSVTV